MGPPAQGQWKQKYFKLTYWGEGGWVESQGPRGSGVRVDFFSL